jgi:hypothetical protein
MRLVKVKKSFYELCKVNNLDNEMLFNQDGRPCVLIVKLDYKEKSRDFVIPLRSNISPKTPEWQYKKLPPNPATKEHHHHGIHFIKIFPIHSKYLDKYIVEGSDYYSVIQRIIDRDEAKIVSECQKYLNEYEKGNGNRMTPDIDGILNLIDQI